MVSKSDMYTFVLLALCSIAAIVNIYYGENPDFNVITNKAIADKYTLIYKLSIAILTLCSASILLLLLKYGGITHKIITLLTLLGMSVIVVLSIITLIFGIMIGIVRPTGYDYHAFWHKSFMGISPLLCGLLGLLLVPSVISVGKHM